MEVITPETNPILHRPVYYSTTVGEAQNLIGRVAATQQLEQQHNSSPEVSYLYPRMALSDQEGSTFDYDVVLDGGILQHDSQGTVLSGRLTPKPGSGHTKIPGQDTEYTVSIGRVSRVGRLGQLLLDRTGINLRLHTVDVMVAHAKGYDPVSLKPVSSVTE